jgi:hypothetical protein
MVKVLAKRWTTAKERIEELKEEMLEIETSLLAEVESVEGGSKTNHLDGYKITVKRPINRTIDGDAWEIVKERIPADLRPVRVKIEPDAKGCDWLRENRPELWAIAAEAITERPGKAGFTVEEEQAK